MKTDHRKLILPLMAIRTLFRLLWNFHITHLAGLFVSIFHDVLAIIGEGKV